jgi:GTPase
MQILYINKIIPKQLPEKYYGNKEYKLNLVFNKKKKTKINDILEKRATQMLFRIIEGDGKAIYLIGIDDNGKNIGILHNELIESIEIIKKLCSIINSEIKSIRIYNGIKGKIASIRIIMNNDIVRSKYININ